MRNHGCRGQDGSTATSPQPQLAAGAARLLKARARAVHAAGRREAGSRVCHQQKPWHSHGSLLTEDTDGPNGGVWRNAVGFTAVGVGIFPPSILTTFSLALKGPGNEPVIGKHLPSESRSSHVRADASSDVAGTLPPSLQPLLSHVDQSDIQPCDSLLECSLW